MSSTLHALDEGAAVRYGKPLASASAGTAAVESSPARKERRSMIMRPLSRARITPSIEFVHFQGEGVVFEAMTGRPTSGLRGRDGLGEGEHRGVEFVG